MSDVVLRLTIHYSDAGDGWIMAQVDQVPGALSQGRTRAEARENVIDALQLMLSPEPETASDPDRELLELSLILPGAPLRTKDDLLTARAQRGSTPDRERVEAIKHELHADEDQLLAFHRAAPIDDFEEELAEAREQAALGQSVSLEEVRRELLGED